MSLLKVGFCAPAYKGNQKRKKSAARTKAVNKLESRARPLLASGESPEIQAERGLQAIPRMEPGFAEVPLPLGEGAAKRRVRARDPPSSGPSGHLLPKGEGLGNPFGAFWTALPREEGNTPLQPCVIHSHL